MRIGSNGVPSLKSERKGQMKQRRSRDRKEERKKERRVNRYLCIGSEPVTLCTLGVFIYLFNAYIAQCKA